MEKHDPELLKSGKIVALCFVIAFALMMWALS